MEMEIMLEGSKLSEDLSMDLVTGISLEADYTPDSEMVTIKGTEEIVADLQGMRQEAVEDSGDLQEVVEDSEEGMEGMEDIMEDIMGDTMEDLFHPLLQDIIVDLKREDIHIQMEVLLED